jgi:hypothetical protein
MAKNTEPYKSYKEWLRSSDEKLKTRLIDSLNRAGIPLEYKTKKRLENLGFEANPYYYDPINFPSFDPTSGVQVGPEVKTRELDFLAILKKQWIIEENIDIHLRLKLAVECKYSSNKDFFVFEFQDQRVSFPNFPIKFNGRIILPSFLYNYFNLPIKIEKVTEADVTKTSKKDDNFNDRSTHTASEQLFSAVSRLLSDSQSEIYRIYGKIVNEMPIKKKFDELDRKGEVIRVQEGGIGYIPDEFQNDFCKKNIKHFDFEKIGSYIIDLVFPMIIIDETRGVIKTILNDSNEIVDFEDVGFGVYKYVADRVPGSGMYGDRDLDREFPIIICNLEYLDKCISKLIEGMEGIMDDVEDLLISEPHLLIKEFMFR